MEARSAGRRERRSEGALSGVWGWLKGNDDYAPPGASTELGRLLWSRPAPLIDPKNKLMVIFSAKAACTNVLVWFFHHLGHAKAARDYHVSPHQYRRYVYYRSKLYADAYRADLAAFKVVRVIRDPCERAASGFRHLVGHSDRPFGKSVGMNKVPKTGLSFSEYLDFLERLDLTNCDVHFAQQRHPIEDRLKIDYLINVSADDLYARLNAIETDLGLQRMDLRGSDWVRRIDRRNRPSEKSATGPDVSTRRFFPKQARDGPWPPYDDLLTAAARERLARLYAVDFQTYGLKR